MSRFCFVLESEEMSYTFETVLGTITENELGHTQPHEHVYIVGTVDQLHCGEICINRLPASAEELKLYRAAGGNTVVDATPIASGRDALALMDISRLSGVNIIAATGYHLPKFYPQNHWIWTEPVEKLADLFTDEIVNGMYLDGCYFPPTYQTSCKAGIVKAVITHEGLDDSQTLAHLTAAGMATKRTGTPIMIHTEAGKDAVRAVELLSDKLGVPPEKILICHVDRQAEDYSIHEAVAATGVFMEYDTITMFNKHNAASEIRLIRHMAEKGFLERMLISTDPTTDRLKSYGGNVGIDYILTEFIPRMRTAGFAEDEIVRITRLNPQIALSKY